MKLLMLSLLILAGCSSGGGGNSSPQQKAFSGSPTALNGRWSGNGTVVYGQSNPKPITVDFVISQLPSGFDLSIKTANERGQPEMETSLTGHRITNNQIFDVRDGANVGSVGAQGFVIGRQQMGTIEARANAAGDLVVHAVVDYGSGYTVIYDATLSSW